MWKKTDQFKKRELGDMSQAQESGGEEEEECVRNIK